MSFQAYLDNIKAKTGKTPEDFKKLAEANGILKPGVKAGEVIAWLKKDFNLGHGHGMAIFAFLTGMQEGYKNPEDGIDKLFSGSKAHWRPTFEAILGRLNENGKTVQASPTKTYISFLKNGKKFAIVAPTGERMDIGIKLKGVAPTERFESSANWNDMVTHRVRISNAADIDTEVLDWLDMAYVQG